MVRKGDHNQTDNVTFDRSTWRWLIGGVLSGMLTVGVAAGAVVQAAYAVAGDVQDMRLSVESRVTKIETLLVEYVRRVERLESRHDGGKP